MSGVNHMKEEKILFVRITCYIFSTNMKSYMFFRIVSIIYARTYHIES